MDKAFISGFACDIFISYSHIDNLKDYGENDGWVDRFCESFTVNITKKVGLNEAVNIWWDKNKLDGGRLFNKTIEEGINRSAIMISLVSRGYLNSEYCTQERETFYKKAQLERYGTAIGDKSRLIKVFINKYKPEELPQEFQGTTGFNFYNDDDRPLKIGDNDHYIKHRDELVDSVYNLLNSFSQEAAFPENFTIIGRPLYDSNQSTAVFSPSCKPDKKEFTIFFGDVTEKLTSVRKLLMKELEKGGYKTVTVPISDDNETYQNDLKNALANADLSVHLLSKAPGPEIEGKNNWYPKMQIELSFQFASLKSIWVPSDLKEEQIEEEQYRKFLQDLERNTFEKKFDFIRGNSSELVQQITEYAKSIVKRKIDEEQHNKVSVLVDSHNSDNKNAYKLSIRLEENHLSSLFNPYLDEPSKNIDEMANRICRVNKLIFLYGNVSRDYIEERVNAVLQLIVNNNYPIKDFYIYAAPPFKSQKDLDIKPLQQYLKVNVTNDSTLPDLNDEVIDKFIMQIKNQWA